MGKIVGRKSGSAPWVWWNDGLFVGDVYESHYELIRRLLPDDIATLGFLDQEGAVTGRVWMNWGEATDFTVYSADEVDKETLRKLSSEFGVKKYG
jgi:hypothetical protein